MTPTPESNYAEEKRKENGERGIHADLPPGEEIVISGISGQFPKSRNIAELMENLYKNEDMVSPENSRFHSDHPEVSNYLGVIDDIDKFDAQFFKVHHKQSAILDSMCKKLLEQAFQAIYDSGTNMQEIRKAKVGVFIGTTVSEMEKIFIYQSQIKNGFGMSGFSKAMFANRISYWLDGKGPSYSTDAGCASSLVCLEQAYHSMKAGLCDYAVVGGSNLCICPELMLNMKRAGFLCLDGKTKCFDKNGDGYVRAEAMCVLLLQKAKTAKRVYAQLYHVKSSYSKDSNDSFKPSRTSEHIQKFLHDFYSEIDVNPSDVDYVEANGVGIAEADGNELDAIGTVFGKTKPVKVGCIKSNMGNTEPVSTAAGIVKVCLAYKTGQVPANLHYKDPLDHIPSVRDGNVKVITKNTPLKPGFTAINCFSYSGIDGHVLLKSYSMPKKTQNYVSSIPRIVLISGRQQECVDNTISELNSKPIDPEQIGLLHEVHSSEISGHMCRGYTILDTDKEKGETVCLSKKIEFVTDQVRPIWFVYSGMGSQWATMGSDLMRIPIFAHSIQRCHNVLAPKGINIVDIITNPDKNTFANILHSFVGIAAVQIGLTDVLRQLGIVPDHIIGHSVGELGCAYADGCFTAEEMILSAYSRGLVSVQMPFIHGSMAAVGLGYQKVMPLLPPEIQVACHNSAESSTISGPSDKMKEFVEVLTAQGIFAREVPCSNIAYHSRYIAKAGPNLLKYLNEVIVTPKPRSNKWLSTSIPESRWNEDIAKFSSAEYHTNNLLSPVLFEETAVHIPQNALCIEVAPHGLLQAILKRSHRDCVHVPLTRRGHPDQVHFMLEAIGKLYEEGLYPKVSELYQKVEFPVRVETSTLSNLVQWDHSEIWLTFMPKNSEKVHTIGRKFVSSLYDEHYKYIHDNVKEGKIMFPEMTMLFLVWETLAMYSDIKYHRMAVTFQDLEFNSEVLVHPDSFMKLNIMRLKGNGKFEVEVDGTTILSGVVNQIVKPIFHAIQKPKVNEEIMLNSKDVYRIFKAKGYNYGPEFQNIHSTSEKFETARIKWSNNWATFLDSIVQLSALARNHDGLSRLKLIKSLIIDPKAAMFDKHGEYNDAVLNFDQGIARCAGVEFHDIKFVDVPKSRKDPDILESRVFVPHISYNGTDVNSALIIALQVVAENTINKEVRVTEIVSDLVSICDILKNAADFISTSKFKFDSIMADEVSLLTDSDVEKLSQTNLLIVSNLLSNLEVEEHLSKLIDKNTFVLSLEQNAPNVKQASKVFDLISVAFVHEKTLALLKKIDTNHQNTVTYIPIVHDTKFSWIPKVKSELQLSRSVVLVSHNQPYCGISGLVQKMSKELSKEIGLVVIDDDKAPAFDPKNAYYKEQLKKKLNVNVNLKGKWGGYYYLPCKNYTNIQNVQLAISEPGAIDNLHWEEAPAVSDQTNSVQVYYAGVSIKDVEKAVAKEEIGKNTFGMDFSGVDDKGRKVMGVVPGGSISSSVTADKDLLWPVPDHWTLEEAATVPLPYVHAYYCLAIRSTLLKSQSVFVTDGASAFGQALITICLALDSTVYTTVSDIKKKRFLLRAFPKLDEKNIACCRDDSFQHMVLNNTKGKRCNVVLNSLNGYLRQAAMKCLAGLSVFIDVSDIDMKENQKFGMFYLFEEKNYMAVNVSNVFKPENAIERKQIQAMIAGGISSGIVRPISRVVFPPLDVPRAFRFLSQNRSRGQVLIKMKDPVTLKEGFDVTAGVRCTADGTNVVKLDENENGIEIVEHLISKGAKKLVLVTKDKKSSGYLKLKLGQWNSQNVTVKLSNENLQSEKSCENFLKEAASTDPVKSIFILQNSSSTENNFTEKDLSDHFNQTSLVVANLDLVSRKFCPQLSYFVVLTPGSRNILDSYTSSASETICESRAQTGLPALTLRVTENHRYSTVLSALDSSLKLYYSNVVYFNLNEESEKDILQKISRVLGVDDLDDIPECLSLRDLSLPEGNISEIKSILSDKFHSGYSTSSVLTLTIAELKNITAVKIENNVTTTGLEQFFKVIEENECSNALPVVTMATATNYTTNIEEDLSPDEKHLIIIPGFDGHSSTLTKISEGFKLSAIAFQFSSEETCDDIRQMAAKLLKIHKTKYTSTDKFYIFGYSFGVNLALELAALMEQEGRTGVVFCLDSSPDVLKLQLQEIFENLNENQLQNAIISHMYQLIAGKKSEELEKDLDQIDDWSQKIAYCIHRLKSVVKFSHQYINTIINSSLKRIQMARQYTPDYKLNSKIVLIKGTENGKAEKLPHDYYLAKYTTKPVSVYNLKCDHASITFDCKIANVVNENLGEELLEEFETRNLCEVYTSNVTAF